MRYRLQIYWTGSGAPDRLGQQIAAFQASLGWVHPRLAGWLFENERGEMVPLSSRELCERAVALAAVEWHLGNEQKVCYQPRFVNAADAAPSAEMLLTGGVEPLALGPIFASNRLELLIRAAPGDDLGTRAVLEQALRAAVAVFRPDFGHAGSMSFPQPAEAIFHDGAPVVGWLTYLSSAYPPLPTLPPPALAQPVSDLGTLVAAHADPFLDGEPTHRAAVDGLRDALRAAGVLVPTSALATATVSGSTA